MSGDHKSLKSTRKSCYSSLRRRRGSVVLARSVVAIGTWTSAKSARLSVTKEDLPSGNTSCFEDDKLVDMVHAQYS